MTPEPAPAHGLQRSRATRVIENEPDTELPPPIEHIDGPPPNPFRRRPSTTNIHDGRGESPRPFAFARRRG